MAQTARTRYRGFNGNPEHYEAWDRLAKHAGMNANQFMRWVLLNLDEDDIDKMFARNV